MTVALAGIVVVVAASFAGWLGSMAVAAAERSRAQIAADAAALAAAAEAGPYGRGLQERRAREFAEANGARLVDCWCVDGAPAVQVRVRLGGAVADARAEFDPGSLWVLPGAGVAGLDARLARAVEMLVSASGGRVTVVSAYRSPTRQRQLWAQAIVRHGSAEAADDWVAPPGHSLHERGLAVDLGGDLDLAVDLIDRLRLPLVRPLSHEPWHFELAGARTP